MICHCKSWLMRLLGLVHWDKLAGRALFTGHTENSCQSGLSSQLANHENWQTGLVQFLVRGEQWCWASGCLLQTISRQRCYTNHATDVTGDVSKVTPQFQALLHSIRSHYMMLQHGHLTASQLQTSYTDSLYLVRRLYVQVIPSKLLIFRSELKLYGMPFLSPEMASKTDRNQSKDLR